MMDVDRRPHRTLALMTWALSLALFGCQTSDASPPLPAAQLCLAQSSGGVFDFTLRSPGDACLPENLDLRPYAVGVDDSFLIHGPHPPVVYESSEPAVARVVAQHNGMARVRFLAPGTTTLSAIRGDGVSVAQRELTALEMDHVTYTVGASLLALDAGEPAPTLVVGQPIPFHAAYYAGPRELRGAGVLRVVDGPARFKYGSRTKSDWMVITPHAPGDFRVSWMAGELSGDLNLSAVPSSDIVRLELESAAAAGRNALVVARGYLPDDTLVLGVPARWSLSRSVPPGSLRSAGRGDVFLYVGQGARARMLTAEVGSVSATVAVWPAPDSGSVVRTDDELACAASGNPGAGLSMLAWLISALLVHRLSRRCRLRRFLGPERT